MKAGKILFLLVVIGALLAAIVLTGKTQETRRGAFYAEAEGLILPESRTIPLKGEIVTIIAVDVKDEKLSGVDLRIRYDKEKLRVKRIEAHDPRKVEVVNHRLDEESGTITVAMVSLQMEAEKMPTGVVNLLKIKFATVTEGTAEVSFDGDYENELAGYNPEAEDQGLEIDVSQKAVYTISATPVVTESPKPTRALSQCDERCGYWQKCEEGLRCLPAWWPIGCVDIAIPLEIREKIETEGKLTVDEVADLIKICKEERVN